MNWSSDETQVRINPRLDSETLSRSENLLKQAPKLSGHLWVQSSGSTRSSDESAKWSALSKKAFLASGEAVNKHLEASANDRWGLCLPLFHVSGLSILARCFLAGSSAHRFEGDWEPLRFHRWLSEENISLLSLVPTQLFDLVEAGLRPPPSLRTVVLGGARLEPSLYEKARLLDWPALPSFGMTEFCSQIATANADSPDLILLAHMEAKTDADQTLWLRSPSLFTGFLQERQGQVRWETPMLENGFWRSSDRARLHGRVIEPLGRAGDYVKIKGEGVNLSDLRSRFHAWIGREWPSVATMNFALAAVPDLRSGARLVLAHESTGKEFESVTSDWNRICFPVERLEAKQVKALPRGALGKIQWARLNEMLGERTGAFRG